MKVIYVIADTLRRDHVSVYGDAPWKLPARGAKIQTPNLARFASEAAVFGHAYIGSFPTMPMRFDLMTGHYAFPELGWAPIPADESHITARDGAANWMVYGGTSREQLGGIGTYTNSYQITHESDQYVCRLAGEGQSTIEEPLDTLSAAVDFIVNALGPEENPS